MPVPNTGALLLPLLRIAADGEAHTFDDACDHLSRAFGVSEAERQSARCRIGSARAALVRVEILEATEGKSFRATPRGLSLLKAGVTAEALEAAVTPAAAAPAPKASPAAPAKLAPAKPVPAKPASAKPVPAKPVPAKPTPPKKPKATALPGVDAVGQDALRTAFEASRAALVRAVAEQVKRCSPPFFERLVIDLLVAMGYGGTLERDAGKVVGGPGDGGIDGIVTQDPLGLSTLYVQAKKRDGKQEVGAEEVRGFVGALQKHGAAKGIFVTSGHFSAAAKTEVRPSQNCTVVLIDGERLAHYLVEYGVGVRRQAIYEVKTLDREYFAAP
jgi:Restriction endonuclease